jgi:phage tail-like protein
MGAIDGTKIGMANRFAVTVSPGDHDFGTFSEVSGLDVTWDVLMYQAGDQGNNKWILPGNTKYSTVKLARTACEDTARVKAWLDKTSFTHEPHVVTIKLYDESYKEPPLMMWELKSAMPTKWSITGFKAATSAIATETLELAHVGFLEDEQTV